MFPCVPFTPGPSGTCLIVSIRHIDIVCTITGSRTDKITISEGLQTIHLFWIQQKSVRKREQGAGVTLLELTICKI